MGKALHVLIICSAFENRVCANKESSSYIDRIIYIYIERERERKRLERFGREREVERLRAWVASSSRVVVVVVEREVHSERAREIDRREKEI